MKNCQIGGQAVLEGVMMASRTENALAVRLEDGSISTKKWNRKVRTIKIAKWPVFRGVFSLVDSLTMGVGTITDAAKMLDEDAAEAQPSKFEKFIAKKTGKDAMDVMMVFAVVIAILLAVGLFFFLPTLITGWISKSIESSLLINLIDGLVRICIFLGYLLLIRLLSDIKRTFMYHGAEHKTLACFENDQELTVENVRKMSRLHPRCGTAFLLIVMVITVLIFTLLGWSKNPFIRLGTRLLMIPIVAGLAYEVLRFAASHDNWFVRALRWPGLQLQRLTTAEPDDQMIECAILAFAMVEGSFTDEQIAEMKEKFDRRSPEEKEKDGEQEETPAEPAAEPAQEPAAEETPAAPAEESAETQAEEAPAEPAEEPEAEPAETTEE